MYYYGLLKTGIVYLQATGAEDRTQHYLCILCFSVEIIFNENAE